VVATCREKLSVRKQAAQKFDMQRFDVKKLNNAEVKKIIRLKSQRGFQLWKTWR
jgi:hypothetical protein